MSKDYSRNKTTNKSLKLLCRHLAIHELSLMRKCGFKSCYQDPEVLRKAVELSHVAEAKKLLLSTHHRFFESEHPLLSFKSFAMGLSPEKPEAMIEALSKILGDIPLLDPATVITVIQVLKLLSAAKMSVYDVNVCSTAVAAQSFVCFLADSIVSDSSASASMPRNNSEYMSKDLIPAQTTRISELSNNVPDGGLHNMKITRLLDGDSINRSEECCRVNRLPISYAPEDATKSVMNQFVLGGIAESEIVRDALFCLQGIDGTYIKFDTVSQRYDLKHTIPRCKAIDSMVAKFCAMGTLYKRISYALTKYERNEYSSLVLDAFFQCIRDHLADYYKLIAELEADLNSSDPSSLSLRKLLCWVQEPLQRIRKLALLVEECEDLRGGVLISAVYNVLNNSCQENWILDNGILSSVMKPLVNMIWQWMENGELRDPHNEFFIRDDSTQSWQNRYEIVEDMIPSFFSVSIAERVLSAGKAVNFIRLFCTRGEWLSIPGTPILTEHKQKCSLTGSTTCSLKGPYETENFRNNIFNNLFPCDELELTKDLKNYVFQAAVVKNKKLVELLLENYRLLDHSVAIRSFLLLTNGDFAGKFLDETNEELLRPADSVQQQTLMAALENVANNSTLQLLNPNCLSRVNVRLFKKTDQKDEGWKVFGLGYNVEPPVSLIFNPCHMNEFSLIFALLWKMLYVSYRLTKFWLCITFETKRLRLYPELMRPLNQCIRLGNEMKHFIDNLRSYVTYEVLDVAWTVYRDGLERCEDFDGLQRQHDIYIQTIMEGLFLKNRDMARSVVGLLLGIMDGIMCFIELSNRLVEAAGYYAESVRLNKRNRVDSWQETEIRDSSIYQAEELNRLLTAASEHKNNVHIFISRFEKGFGLYSSTTQHTHRLEQSVRALACRLNFNDYYRDAIAR